ncbi:MAG: hypothetical protein WB390_01290 [Pseudolabrys sp.]
MRTIHRVVLLTGLAAFIPALTACSSGFDPDKLDFLGLNEKKKLPGERKEVFPGGVPGVSQGIPPEYVKGNQPTADSAATPAAEPDKKTAAVEPEPKPKPKPKRPPKPPTQITVQPAQQQQPAPWPQQNQQPAPQQQQSQAPWPPAQGQSNATEPWPSSPQPGTFSR